MSISGGRSPAPSEVRAHTTRIVVKFAPELQLSLSEAAEAEHAATHGQAWEVLRSKFPNVTLRPFFATLDWPHSKNSSGAQSRSELSRGSLPISR